MTVTDAARAEQILRAWIHAKTRPEITTVSLSEWLERMNRALDDPAVKALHRKLQAAASHAGVATYKFAAALNKGVDHDDSD